MTRTNRSLCATAALALVLPSLAAAQEATTGEAGAAVTTLNEGQSMVVTVDSAAASTESRSLEDWTYDELYASGISINEIMGADVYGPEGDDIGDVENVLFDMEGNVLSVVAEIGGFLEIGDTHVSIPWERVSAEEWEDGVVIPFTEDEVDDYVVAYEEVITLDNVSEVQQTSGDGPGVVETGAETWRASDLVGDFARLRDGDAYANQGMINDIVVRDGRIEAMLVSAEPGGTAAGEGAGLYGFPYAGQAGWNDAEGVYDMPYDRGAAQRLQPFDPAMLTD